MIGKCFWCEKCKFAVVIFSLELTRPLCPQCSNYMKESTWECEVECDPYNFLSSRPKAVS